ncbi:MAG: hypothetical protein K940chlam8_00317, partial [Chlamydiae bacterium]|nr:hypothetical protein [Chlamydiota bacterium]
MLEEKKLEIAPLLPFPEELKDSSNLYLQAQQDLLASLLPKEFSSLLDSKTSSKKTGDISMLLEQLPIITFEWNEGFGTLKMLSVLDASQNLTCFVHFMVTKHLFPKSENALESMQSLNFYFLKHEKQPFCMQQCVFKIDAKDENSSGWRPAIEEHNQNYSHNIKSFFVTYLRYCFVYLGKNDIKLLKTNMEILHKEKFSIFKRFELYLYTLFPDEFKNEIEKSLLEYFDCAEFHHEYYHLIKKTFDGISEESKQKIYQFVDEGYDKETFERVKASYDEKIAKQRENYWRLKQLEPIKEYLDEKRKELYLKLIKEFDLPDHLDFDGYFGGVTIGESPIKPKIFDGKSTDEVFEMVINHKVENGSYEFEDNIIRTFEEYVKNNPEECIKKSSELKKVRPIVQYELFFGLRNVLKNNKNINWEEVLPLIEYIISFSLKEKNYPKTS